MDDRHPTFDPAPGRLVASLSGDAPVRHAPPPDARDAALRPLASSSPEQPRAGWWLAAIGVVVVGLVASVAAVLLGLAVAVLVVGA